MASYLLSDSGVTWLEGTGKYDNIKEQFCQGKHVRLTGWPKPERGYQLSDIQFLPLNNPDRFYWSRPSLNFTSICHTTNFYGATGILPFKGFLGVPKFGGSQKVAEAWQKIGLSFWSPVMCPNSSNTLNTYFASMLKDDGHHVSEIDGPSLNFGSSPAFLQSSRYGNYKFSYNIDDFLDQYAISFGKLTKDSVRFRILGTFVYKLEVMHVILVHPTADCLPVDVNETFESIPLLEESTIDPVVIKRGGEWTWKPQVTRDTSYDVDVDDKGVMTKRNNSRYFTQWENLAFAFYTTDEPINITNPIPLRALSFCDIGAINLSKDPKMTGSQAKDLLVSWAKSNRVSWVDDLEASPVIGNNS